jgi:hypothetical protein
LHGEWQNFDLPLSAKDPPMRWLLLIALVCISFTSIGCQVKVEEKPAPVVKPGRKVDVNVDTPGVDVKIKKD